MCRVVEQVSNSDHKALAMPAGGGTLPGCRGHAEQALSMLICALSLLLPARNSCWTLIQALIIRQLRHTAQLLGFKDMWEEVWRTLSALPESSEGPVNHRHRGTAASHTKRVTFCKSSLRTVAWPDLRATCVIWQWCNYLRPCSENIQKLRFYNLMGTLAKPCRTYFLLAGLISRGIAAICERVDNVESI